MKKIVILMLLMALLVLVGGCASGAEQPQSEIVPAETEIAEVKPDEALMQKLVDAIGQELMERGKAANFQLNTKFRHYAYAPNEGWEPREGDYTEDLLFVTVEIYAPKTPGAAADSELLQELQYAIIDSGIFELTEEEKNELKSISYSAENREDSMLVKDPTVELHFLDFDANAVLTIGHLDQGTKNHAHREDWSRTYHWEAFFH